MSAPDQRIALVALGSNLGNSAELIHQAFNRLERLSSTPVRRSTLWTSAPVECPPGSPPFVNAAAALSPLSELTPEGMLGELIGIEVELGRQPKQVLNEPRPIDLDLIAFGQERRNMASLVLPHPRAHLRTFVLAPLAEVAPNFKLPGQDETVKQLLSRIARPGDVSNL